MNSEYCATFTFDLGVRGNHTVTQKLKTTPRDHFSNCSEEELRLINRSEAKSQLKSLLEHEYLDYLEFEENGELTFYPRSRLIKASIFER